MGQPTVMTPETLAKLREAFLMGCSDREAAAYADIAPATIYTYQNNHPEYIEQKESWKQQPILKAKATINSTLHDPKNAQWYLERKLKSEFSLRTETTGKDGGPIETKNETTLSVEERLAKTLDEIKDLQTEDHE